MWVLCVVVVVGVGGNSILFLKSDTLTASSSPLSSFPSVFSSPHFTGAATANKARCLCKIPPLDYSAHISLCTRRGFTHFHLACGALRGLWGHDKKHKWQYRSLKCVREIPESAPRGLYSLQYHSWFLSSRIVNSEGSKMWRRKDWNSPSKAKL